MDLDYLLKEIKVLKKLRKLALSVNYEAANIRDRLPEIDRSIENIITQVTAPNLLQSKMNTCNENTNIKKYKS